MSAIEELKSFLHEDEVVEGIVFGVSWGWGDAPREGKEWDFGFEELETPPVPFDLRGKVLSLEEAELYMEGWSFEGGFGAPECYATYIWTNKRVIWVTQYDGATNLDSMPRNPIPVFPDMPGG